MVTPRYRRLFTSSGVWMPLLTKLPYAKLVVRIVFIKLPEMYDELVVRMAFINLRYIMLNWSLEWAVKACLWSG